MIKFSWLVLWILLSAQSRLFCSMDHGTHLTNVCSLFNFSLKLTSSPFFSTSLGSAWASWLSLHACYLLCADVMFLVSWFLLCVFCQEHVTEWDNVLTVGSMASLYPALPEHLMTYLHFCPHSRRCGRSCIHVPILYFPSRISRSGLSRCVWHRLSFKWYP